MSTENAPAAVPQPAAPNIPDELRIISRSSLFYWWPVWVVGFLMGFITYLNGTVTAEVPKGTEGPFTANTITYEKTKGESVTLNEEREVLIAPKGQKIAYDTNTSVRMSTSKSPGVVFCAILLVVITITNIHLRGLWSLIVIVVFIALVVILALAGVWDTILNWLGILDIRINMGGYILISTFLLIIWLVVYLLFDPQVYMIFSPGSFRVHLEIGEGETQYDTRGMTLQKVRSDFFRHWILGLGSGDLIVRTSGAQAHEFHLPNVLFIGRKVRIIEEMLRRTGAINN